MSGIGRTGGASEGGTEGVEEMEEGKGMCWEAREAKEK